MESVKLADALGFKREVLIMYGLTFESAAPYRADAATKEDWPDPDDATTGREATIYLGFAIGKAYNHRGLSAVRSCEKLTEFAWLLGLDATVKEMDQAPYPRYGVPVLLAFANGAGMMDIWPKDNAKIDNMAKGEPCEPDCQQGCLL